jgi:hypothetical protein
MRPKIHAHIRKISLSSLYLSLSLSSLSSLSLSPCFSHTDKHTLSLSHPSLHDAHASDGADAFAYVAAFSAPTMDACVVDDAVERDVFVADASSSGATLNIAFLMTLLSLSA